MFKANVFRVPVPQAKTSGWAQWYMSAVPPVLRRQRHKKMATNQGQIGLHRAYLKNRRKKNKLEDRKKSSVILPKEKRKDKRKEILSEVQRQG